MLGFPLWDKVVLVQKVCHEQKSVTMSITTWHFPANMDRVFSKKESFIDNLGYIGLFRRLISV
uniref:Uncharacterized protein n=1 Tax=Arundo donax TaxID=35708 RepID=A0A0A9AY10_ARUDO